MILKQPDTKSTQYIECYLTISILAQFHPLQVVHSLWLMPICWIPIHTLESLVENEVLLLEYWQGESKRQCQYYMRWNHDSLPLHCALAKMVKSYLTLIVTFILESIQMFSQALASSSTLIQFNSRWLLFSRISSLIQPTLHSSLY